MRDAIAVVRAAPPSTVRLELQHPTGSNGQWHLLAVPTMRRLRSWAADSETEARTMFAAASELLKVRVRDHTRPDGTCPRCSGALEDPASWPGRGWCPACGLYVVPAGPRVSTAEQLAIDRMRAVNRAKIVRK